MFTGKGILSSSTIDEQMKRLHGKLQDDIVGLWVFQTILALMVINSGLQAQWSTSTNADSSLYVCPGYYPSLITFDDGSSIICGALDDYRFLQKLDPYGYKLWAECVQVYYTPGTNDPYATGMIKDGDGGVILWWRDYRGADFFPGPFFFGPFNNSLFMQRVDKHGNGRWKSGGTQVDTVSGGLKSALGVDDGLGGIVLFKSDNILDSSHTIRKAITCLVHYDASGILTWSATIDSSAGADGLSVNQPVRIANKLMIAAHSGPRFFDCSTGEELNPPIFLPEGKIISDGDSAAFSIKRITDRYDSLGRKYRSYSVTRFETNWDSVWSNSFQVLDAGDLLNTVPINNNAWPDKLGGVFFWEPSSNDSTRPGARLRRVTRSTSSFNDDRVEVYPTGLTWGFNGRGQCGLFAESGTASKFDTAGRSIWPSNLFVMTNAENTNALQVASDNNGGGIIAFWNTIGGIYAQHTGRSGRIGIITDASFEEPSVFNYQLSQNFPNPFNPSTTIRFSMTRRALVTLKVFDLLGEEVVTLLNQQLAVGEHEVKWDASRFGGCFKLS